MKYYKGKCSSCGKTIKYECLESYAFVSMICTECYSDFVTLFQYEDKITKRKENKK